MLPPRSRGRAPDADHMLSDPWTPSSCGSPESRRLRDRYAQRVLRVRSLEAGRVRAREHADSGERRLAAGAAKCVRHVFNTRSSSCRRGWRWGPLQVYDVSNMSAPVHATTYRVPGGTGAVALKGTLAYTAGREGLQVVDLGTPSQPAILGAYQTAKPARGVAVTGSLVLAVIANDEVLILRQSP